MTPRYVQNITDMLQSTVREGQAMRSYHDLNKSQVASRILNMVLPADGTVKIADNGLDFSIDIRGSSPERYVLNLSNIKPKASHFFFSFFSILVFFAIGLIY